MARSFKQLSFLLAAGSIVLTGFAAKIPTVQAQGSSETGSRIKYEDPSIAQPSANSPAASAPEKSGSSGRPPSGATTSSGVPASSATAPASSRGLPSNFADVPASFAQPLNDHIPLPMPSFGVSNPLGEYHTKELTPLASVAPTGIEITAKPVSIDLQGLSATLIHVKNNTDRPVTFNGEETVATMGGEHLKAAPMSELSDRIRKSDNPKGYFGRSVENTFTAALTVGVAQTVQGELTHRGPIAGRYGFDNANRAERLSRFAERILWPGDTSDGIVYFKTSRALNGAALTVPVADFYDKQDKATIPAVVR